MASETTTSPGSEKSLKIAIAMALLRSNLLKKPSDTPPASSDSEALKWKQKAKERKQEILRLKQDLVQVEDEMHHELFAGNASCKCYFFDNLGKLSTNKVSGEGSDERFKDVLRRRFIRQVRLKERRKRRNEGSRQRLQLSDNKAEEIEQLKASVDFLVELCDTPNDANFANWSHQAVDFILDSIGNTLSKGNNIESVEGIVGSLSLHLVRKMCTTLQVNEAPHDARFHVQHLLRKLGRESCIGQRVILAVSQRICSLAENLLFLDPFESTFSEMHSNLYILIQLIEFLVSDYLISWSKTNGFAIELFEEWVTSILHARKGLQLLENRCGLYIIYMDRVIGLIAKLVGQAESLQKLNPNMLQSLFS
ncbi:protein MULTIPOLAR SPINDLE 1-like [Bidens hawaiensis]|uniref:protein MULTIPOLAR SPINDLE 1-like n=1 Tax=Bidens hawaiensis TaxID=980011 RepID=UPI00404AFA6E